MDSQHFLLVGLTQGFLVVKYTLAVSPGFGDSNTKMEPCYYLGGQQNLEKEGEMVSLHKLGIFTCLQQYTAVKSVTFQNSVHKLPVFPDLSSQRCCSAHVFLK